jgi:hypothetical protein
MSFTEDDIKAAGRAIALREDQVEGLVAVLRARRAGSPAISVHASPERVRFDIVHVLWYAGALIVMGAMTLFSTLAFEAMGGTALTVTALVYAALFLLAGHHLWHRRGLHTPGGLMVVVAVAMAPLAVYGIQDAFGLWGDGGDPGRYRDFFVWIKGSWLPMEIVTVIASLLALRFYPFPFMVAILAIGLWFMSMDLTPWLLHGRDMTWSETWTARQTVSMIFGLIMIGAAWFIDLKRDSRQDFAFWLHLYGLLAFWGAMTISDSSSELAKLLYCVINVGLVLLSVFLLRPIYAVFGAIGVAVYLGYLASRVFANSLIFTFALSLIGVAIIGAGLLLQRHRTALSAWMTRSLPETITKLRPPHAGAAQRLEHA